MEKFSLIELKDLNESTAFQVKREISLYLTAEVILNNNKGNREKLINYMQERIKNIEKLLSIIKPFKIFDNGKLLLEVD